MNYRELTGILQDQVQALTKTIATLNNSLESQQITLESQSQTIELLTSEISELKAIILKKDVKSEKLANQLNGLTKIAFSKKIERVSYVDNTLKSDTPAPTPKERGNNGSKRKVYDNLEEIIEEVDPSHPEFIAHRDSAKFMFHHDIVRYKFLPPKLIKHIYRCNSYNLNDTVFEAKAPISPFLNSNFDSSVIANLMQQRYIYGLPVERIVRYFNEIGMDIPKQTAHGLLKKGAELLDRLSSVLKSAIHRCLDREIESNI